MVMQAGGCFKHLGWNGVVRLGLLAFDGEKTRPLLSHRPHLESDDERQQDVVVPLVPHEGAGIVQVDEDHRRAHAHQVELAAVMEGAVEPAVQSLDQPKVEAKHAPCHMPHVRCQEQHARPAAAEALRLCLPLTC